MATIAINRNPRMTQYLVEQMDVFRDDPVTIVDVGARWGFNPEWEVFGKHLRVYGFEPDEEECRRLNASAAPNVRYLPFALGRADGEATLYETKLSASSGLYRSDMSYLGRLTTRDNAVVVRETRVRLQTLVAALREFNVLAVDFIKLDVEGAELDVLMGGEHYLAEGLLLGILSEIRFQEEINGCPIFWQLDEYVRRFGFRLYNLQFYHQSRHALPYPGLANYLTPEGQRFFAYTTHGQIMDGDALYFRDLLIPANRGRRAAATVPQLLKLAAFLEIYCFNDCAAELIVSSREKLEPAISCKALLDLLTPAFEGTEFDYESYIRRYFHSAEGVLARASPTAPSMIPDQLRTDLDRVYAALRWRLAKVFRAMKGLIGRLRARLIK